jgi:hypothetical protein
MNLSYSIKNDILPPENNNSLRKELYDDLCSQIDYNLYCHLMSKFHTQFNIHNQLFEQLFEQLYVAL